MNLGSQHVGLKILEKASQLSFKIYDCCVDSCLCFAGQFSDHQECDMCGKARFDHRGKPRNRFRYIPILPRLQAMFHDPILVGLLLYRMQREVAPDKIRDVWDGQLLQELLDTYVVVDGVEQDFKYGQAITDMFVAVTCDGVSLFKGLGARRSKNQYSCFPLVAILLNLPPSHRTRDENVFFLGAIPGPHEPKHLDSFLWAFYEECREGLNGIRTYHAQTREFFQLRLYVVHFFGDLKAMIKARGIVGVNGLVPCGQCPAEAVRHPTDPKKKTLYFPLTLPGEDEDRLGWILNNIRTHDSYLEVYHQLDTAEDDNERDRIRKSTGIKHPTVLSLLPYWDNARGILNGFMHAVFINQFKQLYLLWRGQYKGLDEGTGNYVIPENVWKEIGAETQAAVKLLPAAFVRSMPNIESDFNSYTAEDCAFWLTWLAPYLLENRLPEPYYSHLLRYIKIIKMCTDFNMTRAQHAEMASEMYAWRLDFERYALHLLSGRSHVLFRLYYQYDPDRLCVMTAAGHENDHIPDDILFGGPVHVLWEFVGERAMGKAGRKIDSRRYPFAQLANDLLHEEQIKVLRMKYPDLKDKLDFLPPRRDWDTLSKFEKSFPEISE